MVIYDYRCFVIVNCIPVREFRAHVLGVYKGLRVDHMWGY